MADKPLHEFKTCTKCRKAKPAINEFFSRTTKSKCGLRPHCKACVNAAEKLRREANPDEGRIRGALWYAANRERRNLKSNAYYAANKERIAANRMARIKADPDGMKRKWREWANGRYRNNPHFRVHACVSPAIRKSLKGAKAGRGWQEIVGYTVNDLKAHLERQFERGMSWENYGKVWEIDHIRPVAAYDFTKGEEEIRACWALSNLRPLCAKENRVKGKKILLLV